MSTSKPMSDGGKGSVRRNEDTEAYRNNYDNIFRKKDKEPMINEHEEHYDEDDGDYDWSCEACGGPMHRTEDGRHGQCDDCGRYCDLESDYGD